MMNENEFWQAIRATFKWTMCHPDPSITYYISVFDDGNEKFKQYKNLWHIYGNWCGKCALVNSDDSNIRIESISSWKIIKINEEQI